MPSAYASLPLSRSPQSLTVTSMPLEGGRVATPSLHTLRPAPTVHGALSAVLRDLQRSMPKPLERRLLQKLDQPRRPPPDLLGRIWAWASPDEGGMTALDELGRDRCALACSLWAATGRRELESALRQGERAVLELLRGVVDRVTSGAPNGEAQAKRRASEARLDAAEAYLGRTGCPPRRHLGVLLLAWSAPAELGVREFEEALATTDAVVNALAADLDDVRLLAQRTALAVWRRPVARAALRQFLPVFLPACVGLANAENGRNPLEEASELMAQLAALVAHPEEVVGALSRDARRLPWSSDPALVRARCICALVQLHGEVRSVAMDLVCARSPRQILQKAACSGHVPPPEQPEALALVRRATLYGAFSVAVGQEAAERAGQPRALEPSLSLACEEFYGLLEGAHEGPLLRRALGTAIDGPRVAGMRVLNAHAGSERLRGTLGLLLIQAAAERPEPLDGRQMLTLLALSNMAVLQDDDAVHESQIRYGLLLRLLLTPLPEPLDRFEPVLSALMGEHSCSGHPTPPSLRQMQQTVDFVGRLLDRPTTLGTRTVLCLAIEEATCGLSCRSEAVVVAERISRLNETGWEVLLTQSMVKGSLSELSTYDRLARIDEVMALHPQLDPASNSLARVCTTETSPKLATNAVDDAPCRPSAVTRTTPRAADGWNAARQAMVRAADASFAGGDAARRGQKKHLESTQPPAHAPQVLQQRAPAPDAPVAAPAPPAEALRDADASPSHAALRHKVSEVATVARQLERQETHLLRDPNVASSPGAEASRRAAKLASFAAARAEAFLGGPDGHASTFGRSSALGAIERIERNLAEAFDLAEAAARQRGVENATARGPCVGDADSSAPGPVGVVRGKKTMARRKMAAANPEAASVPAGPRALPGPRGYVWYPAAGRGTTVNLDSSFAAKGPLARLRHAMWRELGAQKSLGLQRALEDCIQTLQAWLEQVGHTSADHALRPGELETLEAVRTAAADWQIRRSARLTPGFAVMLAAALVWRQLGSGAARPYWTADEGRARHYRALFGVLAGVGCPEFACRQLHFGQLARVWLQARRGALFGWQAS